MPFKSKLIVSVPLHDDRMRELQATLIYDNIQVPKGFKTDYASVPKLFWTILPPTGSYTYAAVVHDYLYASGIMLKDAADKVFYDIMKELGVSKFKAWSMYNAVKYFGNSAWNEHKKRRENETLNNLNDGIGI